MKRDATIICGFILMASGHTRKHIHLFSLSPIADELLKVECFHWPLNSSARAGTYRLNVKWKGSHTSISPLRQILHCATSCANGHVLGMLLECTVGQKI